MVIRKTSSGYLVRLDKDEELVRSLTKLCADESITSGIVSGIGGAQWAELAFYHLDQKAYEFDRIDEPLELSALSGNISLVNGKPSLHLHATVSDMNYHAYGGHLKELAVAGTCEVFIQVLDTTLERVHNDNVGLKVLDL